MHFDSPQSARDFISSTWAELHKLRAEKKWEKAGDLSRKRLFVARHLYKTDPSIEHTRLLADTLCGQAYSKRLRGEFHKGFTTYLQANRLRESTLSHEYDNAFTTRLAKGYFQQAFCLQSLGRYEQAAVLFAKAKERFEECCPDDTDCWVGCCLHGLGVCAWYSGQVDQALLYYEQAKYLYQIALPNGNPDTASNLSLLVGFFADNLIEMEKPEDAKAHLREAIENLNNNYSLRERAPFATNLYKKLQELSHSAECIDINRALVELTTFEKSSRLKIAGAECSLAHSLLSIGSYTEAHHHVLRSAKHLEKHRRKCKENIDNFRTWVSNNDAHIKNALRNKPEPSARRSVVSRTLDKCSLCIYRPSPQSLREMFFELSKIWCVLFVSMFFFLNYFTDSPFKYLLVASIMSIEALLLSPRVGRRSLKKLSDAYESWYLKSLAKRANNSLPTILSRFILTKKHGETCFRLWAVPFAYPAGLLEQISEYALTDQVPVTRVPNSIQRPHVAEIQQRRFVAETRLSMPNSMRRQFFPLLPRGTHPLGLGTL